MPSWFRRTEAGVLVLSIHAQPGAKRTEAVGVHGDSLKIRVAAPALEDRANAALIEFLAASLQVPKRQVTLVAGARGREKRFEIVGSVISPETALSI